MEHTGPPLPSSPCIFFLANVLLKLPGNVHNVLRQRHWPRASDGVYHEETSGLWLLGYESSAATRCDPEVEFNQREVGP
jgi:hypothetical protein